MSDRLVLTEDESLELLSFLVASARTELDEPHEYCPGRMLTASRRLSDFVSQRASPETSAFLSSTFKQGSMGGGTPQSDRAAYIGRIDALCATVAGYMVKHFGADRT